MQISVKMKIYKLSYFLVFSFVKLSLMCIHKISCHRWNNQFMAKIFSIIISRSVLFNILIYIYKFPSTFSSKTIFFYILLSGSVNVLAENCMQNKLSTQLLFSIKMKIQNYLPNKFSILHFWKNFIKTQYVSFHIFISISSSHLSLSHIIPYTHDPWTTCPIRISLKFYANAFPGGWVNH